MYHLISYYNIKNDKFIIHNTKEEIEKFLEKKESYLSFSIYKNLTKYKTPNSKFYRNEISSDFINTYNKNIFFNADYKINNYILNENDKIVFFQLFNKRDREVYKDALDNGTTPLCQIYLKNDGIYFSFVKNQYIKNELNKPKRTEKKICNFIEKFNLSVSLSNTEMEININNVSNKEILDNIPNKISVKYGCYLNIDKLVEEKYEILIKNIIIEEK